MTKATPHHAASEAPRRCIDHSSLAMRHCSLLVAMSLCSVVVFPRPLVMPGGFLLGVAPLMCQPGLDNGGSALQPGPPPWGGRNRRAGCLLLGRPSPPLHGATIHESRT